MKKNRMEDLISRSERCCCKQCGGKLEIRIVVYNKYGGSGAELYCDHCQKIEYGTEPEIYRAAKDFVDRLGFNHFVDLEENERTYMGGKGFEVLVVLKHAVVIQYTPYAEPMVLAGNKFQHIGQQRENPRQGS